jgi:hypothetical protein
MTRLVLQSEREWVGSPGNETVFFRHVCEERPLNPQNMREWTLVRTLGRRDAVRKVSVAE